MSASPTPADSFWRYRLLGEEFGPVPYAALQELVVTGQLSGTDEVALVGGDWCIVNDVAELAPRTDDGGDPVVLDDGLSALLEQAGQVDHAATADHTVVAGWYARILGAELGPLEWDRLAGMATQGELSADDEIRRGTAGPWQRAGEIVGLFESRSASSFSTNEPAADARMRRWFRELPGGAVVTVTWDDLQSLAAAGELTPRDRIRETAAGPWLRAASLPGLFTEQERSRTWAGQAEQGVPPAVSVSAVALSEDAVSTEPPVAAPRPAEPRPEAPVAAAPAAGPVEPPDQWSKFFADAEARDRKRRKRDNPAGGAVTPTPPAKVAAGEIHLAPPSGTGSAGSMAAMPHRPQTPPPPTPAPKPVPAFVPSKPRRSVSLPSFNVSGLLGKLKGDGEGGVGLKLLIPLVIGLVVMGLKFMPSFGGHAGAEDYPVLAGFWQRALQLKESQGTAAAWSALQAEATPAIDDMQSRLAPIVESAGKEAPIAQRILWMVDRDTGPTSSSGYLRKVLSAGPTAQAADFTNGTAVMSEAGNLLKTP